MHTKALRTWVVALALAGAAGACGTDTAPDNLHAESRDGAHRGYSENPLDEASDPAEARDAPTSQGENDARAAGKVEVDVDRDRRDEEPSDEGDGSAKPATANLQSCLVTQIVEGESTSHCLEWQGELAPELSDAYCTETGIELITRTRRQAGCDRAQAWAVCSLSLEGRVERTVYYAAVEAAEAACTDMNGVFQRL